MPTILCPPLRLTSSKSPKVRASVPLEAMLTPVEIKVFLRLCSFCGAEAFDGGEERADNPWFVGTEEHRAWIEGWFTAAGDLPGEGTWRSMSACRDPLLAGETKTRAMSEQSTNMLACGALRSGGKTC
jgi:hypothetical protein